DEPVRRDVDRFIAVGNIVAEEEVERISRVALEREKLLSFLRHGHGGSTVVLNPVQTDLRENRPGSSPGAERALRERPARPDAVGQYGACEELVRFERSRSRRVALTRVVTGVVDPEALPLSIPREVSGRVGTGLEIRQHVVVESIWGDRRV